MNNDVLNQIIDDYITLYRTEKEKRQKLQQRIDKATEYIEYKKNEAKEEIVKLKNNDDFYNYFNQKLNVILEILGDKE